MQEIEKDKLCYYCLGCNQLENEDFKGINECKNYIRGKSMAEYYKLLERR